MRTRCCTSPLCFAEVWITSCAVAIQSGRLSEANRAAAFRGRGTGHGAKREAALAAADFDEAVRIGPGTATDHARRGHTELERGAIDDAIADYGRAIEAAPNSHQPHSGLGRRPL